MTRKSEDVDSRWGFGLLVSSFNLEQEIQVLQRLYSSFARGWPGIGLLCLRLVTAIVVFRFGETEWASKSSFWQIAVQGIAGLLLCVGLWTPLAGGALSVFELWSAFSGKGNFWVEILLAAVCAALAMLGPGAWSIDARLFGRKRLIPAR